MSAARIPPELLRRAESAVEELLGVASTGPLSRRVEDAVVRASGELGMDPESLVTRLCAQDPRCAAAVIERTVVRETYFGRYPEQLAAIVQHVFHAERPDRPLRIWSAGCATGEEAYELAMALLASGRCKGLDRIVATDASEHALKQARAAEYGERSIRRLDAVTRRRFFVGSRPPLVVAPEVRELVEFRRSNLVRDVSPTGPVDLVLCRNVLIYFSSRAASSVLRTIAAALRPGGFLALGPAEAPLASGLPLEWVGDVSTVLMRRLSAEAEALASQRTCLPAAHAPDRSRAERLQWRPIGRMGKPPPPSPREPARGTARRDDAVVAERLAREASASACSPEPYLLLAMAAEARAELGDAIALLRRALYLDPKLAVAHASMAALHRRMGRRDEARRAARSALRALEGLEDGTLLPGVARMTAGALREALQQGGWRAHPASL